MLRYLKAMYIFARFQAWVDGIDWTKDDATALNHFLGSPSGYKLRLALLNMQLRQQATAVTTTTRLEFEAGYCNGQKGAIAFITSMADLTQFPEEGLDDADPSLNQ